MKYRKKIAYCLIFILIVVTGVACSNPLQKKEPKKQSDSETKEQPKDFVRIISATDEIYDTLVELEVMQRTGEPKDQKQGDEKAPKENSQPTQDGKEQQGDKQKSKEGSSGSDQQVQGMEMTGAGGQGKGGGGEQSGGGEKSQEQGNKSQEEGNKEIEKLWSDLEEAVQQLHESWNSFEPKTEEDNISPDAVSGFEENLLKLSAAVKDKKIIESLSSVVGLQKYLSDFTMPYKEVMPAGLYDVKYYYHEAYINCVQEAWTDAKEQVKKALQEWDKLAPDMQKEDEELTKKMEFALKDLDKAIDTQDMDVIEMKFSVIDDNYKAFEKTFKDKEKEEKEKKGK